MASPSTLQLSVTDAVGSALKRLGFHDAGVAAIDIERARVLPTYTPEHDLAEHTDGEMVDAAIAYLVGHGADKDRTPYEKVPHRWPWDASDYQPGNTGNYDADRIRDLTRAGQFIAADLTRLLAAPGRLPLEP